MARSKSSHRWLQEHHDDPYVLRARREGWRSRAVYKLEELDARHHFLRNRPAPAVVDLGAAPGGWSQWIARRTDGRARIVALDILPMDSLPGVEFIQGDFTSQEVFERLRQALGGVESDLVLSDMAPNISGMNAVDQPRAMLLAELARDFALEHLITGGTFVTKLFQGEGSDAFIQALRREFSKVVIRKPKASRPRSREVYVVAEGLRRYTSPLP